MAAENYSARKHVAGGLKTGISISARIWRALGTIWSRQGIWSLISRRKRIEEELRLAIEQAHADSVAKSQFLANMSHEIRTPMNAILGMLKLVQSTELTARQFDYISKSESAAKALLALINDILDFSKIDAGKLVLDLHAFRLDTVMRDLAVLLSAGPLNKPVEVLFDVDPELPEVLVGDALRIKQVLLNLSSNALKFTSEGQVVIAIRSVDDKPQTAGSIRLRFSVADSGIGIAEEHREHIFSGFSQAEGSITRKFGGTGLGLAISQRLVQSMGGKIELTSAVGHGTTFFFTLELPIPEAIPAELVQPVRALSHPYRVLIVDDNALVRNLMRSMTAGWSSYCEVADGGESALQRIRETIASAGRPFEVIYLDCEMPGIDGWETARVIRELYTQYSLPRPYVIMVTSNSRETLASHSQYDQDLLDDFLVKPVTASMLLDAVLNAVPGARSPTARVRRPHGNAGRVHALRGMRILLVEDNVINQQVARELLESQGAFVTLAANGQLGIDALVSASRPFDAVLMDVQMPVLDGFTATRIIRNDLNLKQLPIIGLTANAMPSDRNACLEAGMSAHIAKPFDLTLLVSTLIALTGHAIASEAMPTAEPLTDDQEDLDRAITRMGGSDALYLRAATHYRSSLPGLPALVLQSMNDVDWSRVRMLAHSNKGSAATLGLNALAEQCRQIEERCLREAPSFSVGWEDALEAAVGLGCRTLDANILTLQKRVVSNLKSAGIARRDVLPEAIVSNTQIRQLLNAWLSLLESDDMLVMEKFAQAGPLIDRLPAEEREQIDRLGDALQELDFARALAICKALTDAQDEHGRRHSSVSGQLTGA